MAESIRLSDGTVEYIFDDKPVFLKRLIEDKLGPEVARCFSECIFEICEELKYVRESCTEHEKVADGYLPPCALRLRNGGHARGCARYT